MAIIDNRTTEDGDVLIIKTDEPVLGLVALTQFVDTTTENPPTDYYLKEFRVSLDGGLTFNAWQELTNTNLQNTEVHRQDLVVIEYRYTAVGNPPPLNLEFNDILVNATEGENLTYPVYDKTVFKRFFEVNDITVFGWALNVLEKIYKKGLILPDYITRDDNNNNNLEDEDFITFWNSITHYFAIIVYYARQYENISSNQILIEQFLLSKDLQLPVDRNLTDLIYLYENYVDEYKKRGTVQIIDKVADGADIDGELLRLIGYELINEFLFAILKPRVTGWCIGSSSPTWRGTEFSENVVKGYEKTYDVIDLANYPLVNPATIGLLNGEIIINAVPANTQSGIDYDADPNKRIVVSPNIDYEIAFRVKQSQTFANITFGCRAYDKDGNVVSLQNSISGDQTNFFFEKKDLNLVNQYYWVRGILWNSSKPLQAGGTTLGGNNLRIPANVVYIVPIIIVDNGGTPDTGNLTYFTDIKVRPFKFNFSVGKLGVRPIIYSILKNNNGELNNEDVERVIKEKLIPFTFFLKSNFIS